MTTPSDASPATAVIAIVIALTLTLSAQGQHPPAAGPAVPLQPLAQQVRRIETALRYLGQPLSAADSQAINDAVALSDERAAVDRLQQVLDRYALARVHINPESRVRVEPGAAKPELVQGGTRLFLVKVLNEAHVTSPLAVQSPNVGPVYIRSSGIAAGENGADRDGRAGSMGRDLDLRSRADARPSLGARRSSTAILEVFSRDAGQRSAQVSFNVGQGTQDVGFRNDTRRALHVGPGAPNPSAIQDEHGRPTTAGVIVRDERERIYPNISKRLEPDFFFQPQVYRADGATLSLPAGAFTVHRVARPGIPHANSAGSTSPGRRSCRSSSNAGSIRHATAGIQAITTSTPPGARTTRTRRKASRRSRCGLRSKARR